MGGDEGAGSRDHTAILARRGRGPCHEATHAQGDMMGHAGRHVRLKYERGDCF